jgi:hypothetical protein
VLLLVLSPCSFTLLLAFGEVAGIEAGGGRCGEEGKEKGWMVLGKTPIAARVWRWRRRGFK